MKSSLSAIFAALLFFIFFAVPFLPRTTQADTIYACATVPETFGTASLDPATGAVFTLDTADADSAMFTYPAGFYSSVLTLQASSYSPGATCGSEPAPSGENFVGKMYLVNFYNGSNQSVAAINNAASVMMQYSAADTSGLNESALTPYWWSATTSSWQLITGSAVDTVNHQIIFSTTFSGLFALFAPATSPPVSPPPSNNGGGASGGGGGGGGGASTNINNTTSSTGAQFLGYAYPGSSVTLLKDGQTAAVTKAGPDAKFEVDLSGLSAGTYVFALWAQDSNGNRSLAQTFTVSLTTGATTVISGIFLPPTINIDKTEVKQGDILTILGQSAPQAQVSIVVHSASAIMENVNATSSGAWLYELDTSGLAFGSHTVTARALKNDQYTTFSQVLSFTVGSQNIQKPKTPNSVSTSAAASMADINGDGHVDLTDFSIMAYWYGRPNPPAKVLLDHTTSVDLRDFSILAYYWTG